MSALPVEPAYLPSCSAISAGSFSHSEAAGFDLTTYTYYKVPWTSTFLAWHVLNRRPVPTSAPNRGVIQPPSPWHVFSPLLQTLWPTVTPGIVLGALAGVGCCFFLVWVRLCWPLCADSTTRTASGQPVLSKKQTLAVTQLDCWGPAQLAHPVRPFYSRGRGRVGPPSVTPHPLVPAAALRAVPAAAAWPPAQGAPRAGAGRHRAAVHQRQRVPQPVLPAAARPRAACGHAGQSAQSGHSTAGAGAGGRQRLGPG
jgi:hypothetical protein